MLIIFGDVSIGGEAPAWAEVGTVVGCGQGGCQEGSQGILTEYSEYSENLEYSDNLELEILTEYSEYSEILKNLEHLEC